MPGALAAQLGFDSFDALLSSPADRPVLLVVDNCEHLLDAAAHWLVQILGACQQPTILATSRSPLELPGESVLPLAPLAVPGPESDPMSCPSVQLFLERCREAGAVVGPADLPAVVELCRRVDGLPLAIEIAAARARTMSIAEIVRRLDASVDVLDRPRFRGDPRHRSVADTDPLVLRPAVAGGGPALRGARRVRRSLLRLDGATPWPPSKSPSGSTRCWTSSPTPRSSRSTRAGPRRGTACSRRSGSSPSTGCAAAARSSPPTTASPTTSSPRSGRSSEAPPRSWRPGLLRDLVAAFDDLAEALRWCTAHDSDPRRAYALCATLWGIVHQGRADDIADLARRTLARWPDQGSPAERPVRGRPGDRGVRDRPSRAGPRARRRPRSPASAAPGLASVTLRRVEGQARRALGDTDGRARRLPRGGPGGARAGDAVDGDGARDRRRRGRRPTAGEVGRRRRRARRARRAGRRVRAPSSPRPGPAPRGGGCSCGSTRPPRCR